MTYKIDLNDLDRFFYNRATWKLNFCFWPTRCDNSNKFIWLEYAYCGIACYHGPPGPVDDIRWLKSSEFIILRLTGVIP